MAATRSFLYKIQLNAIKKKLIHEFESSFETNRNKILAIKISARVKRNSSRLSCEEERKEDKKGEERRAEQRRAMRLRGRPATIIFQRVCNHETKRSSVLQERTRIRSALWRGARTTWTAAFLSRKLWRIPCTAVNKRSRQKGRHRGIPGWRKGGRA